MALIYCDSRHVEVRGIISSHYEDNVCADCCEFTVGANQRCECPHKPIAEDSIVMIITLRIFNI